MSGAVASSPRGVETTDRPVAPRETLAQTGGRPFETPLLLAGVRCVLRYMVLPLLLPLLAVATGTTAGIVTGAALALLLTLDVIAVVAIVVTLRRLWRLQHPRRWQYLPLALTLAVLVGIFFVIDARVLV